MEERLVITNDKGSLFLVNKKSEGNQTLTLDRVETDATDKSLQSLLNQIGKFKYELFGKGISRIIIGPVNSAQVTEEELITTTKKSIIRASRGLLVIVEVDNL